jgi:hypothetical protein
MGFAIQNMHRGKKIGVPKTIGTEDLDSNLPSFCELEEQDVAKGGKENSTLITHVYVMRCEFGMEILPLP